MLDSDISTVEALTVELKRLTEQGFLEPHG